MWMKKAQLSISFKCGLHSLKCLVLKKQSSADFISLKISSDVMQQKVLLFSVVRFLHVTLGICFLLLVTVRHSSCNEKGY